MKQIMSVAILSAFMLGGCSQIDKIPDDQFAADLNVGAKAVVKYALTAAVRKYPADAARITADAKTADQVIVQNILPVFSGASTSLVLRGAVDQALAQLRGKITDTRVLAAIELGTEIIIADVPLPKNLADKLDDRTRKALAGIFGGIASGIEAAFPPPAPAPVPAPVPAPPK